MGYQLTSAGLTVMRESEIVAELQAAFVREFGDDAAVDVQKPDSVLSRIIGVMANREAALGEMMQAVYRARSIQDAQGEALDSAAAWKGLTRNGATKTQVTVQLTGDAGASIIKGRRFAISSGEVFLTTETVTLDGSGDGEVDVLADEAGATVVLAGETWTIVSAVPGLTSVANSAAGVTGQEEETEAALRLRIEGSGATGDATRASIESDLADLDTLSHVTVRENDTEDTDADGVPAHYLAVVIYPTPDDADAVGQLIMRKAAGCGTYGDTLVTVTDSKGEAHDVYYTVASEVAVDVTATVTVKARYVAATVKAEVAAAIQSFFDTLAIGQDVHTWELITAIGNVPGVATLTLTLPVADVTIAIDELGIAGTVSVP